MTERENNVYKAKLAEQAERYDGKFNKKREENFFFRCQRSANFGEGSCMQSLWRRVACVTLKNLPKIVYIFHLLVADKKNWEFLIS